MFTLVSPWFFAPNFLLLMAAPPDIQELLKVSDIPGAIAVVKAAIRKSAADEDLRFLLFQLGALAGDWEMAANQVAAYSELNGRQSPLPFVLRRLIAAEVDRENVFAGKAAPVLFGEPNGWLTTLVQALGPAAAENYDGAFELRQRALSEAPANSGTIDGKPFEGLMDGDSRLGPVLEAIMDGKYYWVPFSCIRSLVINPPTQLRDVVWAAAALTLTNDAVVPAHIPVRYPGAQRWADGELKMARSTDWQSPAEGFYQGLGQRMFLSKDGEVSLLDLRNLEFTPPT